MGVIPVSGSSLISSILLVTCFTSSRLSDSPFHLVGTFPGPEGSPYEKGLFDVDIQIPDSYPFQPLKMKFITKVYHPNISSASGAICLDILKDAWSPVSRASERLGSRVGHGSSSPTAHSPPLFSSDPHSEVYTTIIAESALLPRAE